MRRYLFSGDVKFNSTITTDVLIVGSGIAGLYAALCLDGKLKCTVLAKEGIKDSDSYLAQGGVAAALSADDTPCLHFQDTLEAGAGLCNEEAVRVLVKEGITDIQNLLSLGVPFDRKSSGLLEAGLEGGHHRRRILHAKGDATGREIVNALYEKAACQDNITFMFGTFFVDILNDAKGVCGAVVYKNGFHLLLCRSIIICTGGIGRLYTRTTNAEVSTCDGHAAALRAGARLKDMEFVQFHPTGLYSQDVEKRIFLISEAVRGAGGVLRGTDGKRFMTKIHPMAELAPRDIVARGITDEMEKTGCSYVSLDITCKKAEELSERFPTIYAECRRRGIEISKQYIPVCPVQHYMMGGIAAGINGTTDVKGLYACGEAACTGVHGANRLASNSMLECLVFSRRTACSINGNRAFADVGAPFDTYFKLKQKGCGVEPVPDGVSAQNIKSRINAVMGSSCGVVRNSDSMRQGLSELLKIKNTLENVCLPDKDWMEAYNMAAVSCEIVGSAFKRRESIGAHCRKD